MRYDAQRNDALETEKRSNSVKQLCDLYRVVIAIAIGLSFHSIVATQSDSQILNFDRLYLFFAFLITITPFFHGAVRHLYATYVEEDRSSRVKNWAILIDYYILLMQAGFFVTLASSIGSTQNFHILLIIVLSIDVVWGLLASLGFAGTQSQEAEIKWAIINSVAVVVLISILFYPPTKATAGDGLLVLDHLILFICIVRTVVDYGINIPFYCPGPKRH